MTELSVMMPCYCEGENLKVLLPKILDALKKLSVTSEILVVDTNKPMDNTKEVCKKNSEKNCKVLYIPRRNENSYGDAIRTGIEDANGKYLVVMDADGSHNPDDICRLYNEIKTTNGDLVIGSRYVKGGDTDNPKMLIWMSNILNVCYRVLFHLDVKDVSDSFRIYDLKKIKSLKLTCENFDVVEEILIKLKKDYPDLKATEIPIKFNKRLYGESKRDLVRFIFSYLGTIKKLKQLQNE